MENNRKKAYTYTRVSTMNQVDGFSLEGQIQEIERYCEYNNIEIVNRYSDEGKSGTNTKGRPAFQRMMRDIEEKEVQYVIVWKLSRFGRNAQDTLNSLEKLQRHGVELVAKEDGIDSSSKMGKMIITLLSALAEMERDNIIEQTKNGKKVAAGKGLWNGGQAPYGYKLIEKKLVINEEESEIVKKIYNLFTINQIGYTGIAGILNKEGIKPRQAKRKDLKAMAKDPDNGEILIPNAQDWDNSAIKRILDNPVYYGKLQWGKNKIITGQDGKKKRTVGKEIIIVGGDHDAIIDEELWNTTQLRRKETGIKFNKSGSSNPEIRNMLNGIMKCPQCGNGMVTMRDQYIKKNGEVNAYYTYICGYYNNHKNGNCSKNAIKAEYIEGEVVDAIKGYLKRPNVMEEITTHIQGQTDDTEVVKEIEFIKRKLVSLEIKEKRQYEILSGIGVEGNNFKNYNENYVTKIINDITIDMENEKIKLQSKLQQLNAIRQNKLTSDNIKLLIEQFDLAFEKADSEQKKRLIKSLVSEVTLTKTKGDNGKDKVIPKSMKLNFNGEQIDLVGEKFRVYQSHVDIGVDVT